MMEQMALEYFRSMSKSERKSIVKKIFSMLSEEEKLEIAKLLIK